MRGLYRVNEDREAFAATHGKPDVEYHAPEGDGMRTFFCIPLEPGARDSIASVAERLRAATSLRASWVRPANYHLTVRFLGEIDPMLIVDLDRLCKEVAGEMVPFEAPLDRLGAFPTVDRARVLWVGGDAPAEYVKLVNSLNEKLQSVGFVQERKPPVAHVTVARVKSRPDPALGTVVTAMNPLPAQRTRVDRILLMESQLTPEGAVYTSLIDVPLGGTGMTLGSGTRGVEYLDHTADMGIRARGETVEEVFRKAALGLFSLMVDVDTIVPSSCHEVVCRAKSLDALLVEWLSDLLAQKELTGLVFGRFDVVIMQDANGCSMRGSAWGEEIDTQKHEPRTEVKGISYLGLSVRQEDNTWVAECVLDV